MNVRFYAVAFLLLLASTAFGQEGPEIDLDPLAADTLAYLNALIVIVGVQLLKHYWPKLKSKRPIVAQGIVLVFGIALPFIEGITVSLLGASLDLSAVSEVLNGEGLGAAISSGLTSGLMGIGAFHVGRENKRKG